MCPLNPNNDLDTQVLAALSPDTYTSGAVISRQLGITRAAVWKHIEKLRGRGYRIDAVPRRGYRLSSRPDKLTPSELGPLLAGGIVGSHIVHFDEAGSTADEARRLIDEGAPAGTVVIAESQTAGRGRMGRIWETPPGTALAMSVILYPRISPTQAPLLSLATALAVKTGVEAAVERETGQALSIDLKWPNDIFLDGRKLGGILLEMSAELDRVKWVIDSIGLNINNEFSGTELDENAISLRTALGRDIPRLIVTAAILKELDKVRDSSESGAGLAGIAERFSRHDILQGRQVEVSVAGEIVSGLIAGIDEEGRLLLRQKDGEVLHIFSGEATLSPGPDC